MEIKVKVIHFREDSTFLEYNPDYADSGFETSRRKVLNRDQMEMEIIYAIKKFHAAWFRFYDILELTLPDGEILYSKPRNYSTTYCFENGKVIELSEEDLTPTRAIQLQRKNWM